VIGKVLQDPAILLENVYNMDETGVILCMLGSIKVFLSKDDPRDYKGAGVKCTMVTAIECINASGKFLLPMIIWPAYYLLKQLDHVPYPRVVLYNL